MYKTFYKKWSLQDTDENVLIVYAVAIRLDVTEDCLLAAVEFLFLFRATIHPTTAVPAHMIKRIPTVIAIPAVELTGLSSERGIF